MKKRLLSLALVLTMICSLFAAVPVSAASMFTDVNGHWAQATIEELASKGIINGKGAGLYDPEGKVTRAEFAKLLVCTVEDEVENEYGSIKDVPEEAWFNGYVYEALDRGVFYLNELNNGSFMPNESADRETVAVWAVRLLGVEGDSTSMPFTDGGSIKNKVAVATAYNQGIISGDAGTGKFRPNDTLTRAEAATIIKRVITRYQEMNGVRPSRNEIDYNDNILQFEAKENMNILVSVDEEKGVFVFDKINDDIKNLKIGDVFLIKPCDALPTGVAIKVHEIKLEGNKAYITQGDIQLEDIVDEIDIATEVTVGPEHIIPGSLGEGVSIAYADDAGNVDSGVYLADASKQAVGGGINLKDGELSFNLNLTETLYKDSNGGEVKLTVGGALKGMKFKFDKQGEKLKDLKFSFTEEHTEELTISVTGSKKWDAFKRVNKPNQYDRTYQNDPLGLGTTDGHVTPGTKADRDAEKDKIYEMWLETFAKMPAGTTGAARRPYVDMLKNHKQFKKDIKIASIQVPVAPQFGIFFIGDINLVCKATGEISATITGSNTVKQGFEYSGKSGFNKISQIDRAWNSTIAGEFDARAGASIRGGFTWLYVLTADVGLEGGLGFNASTEITAGMSTDDGKVSLSADVPFMDTINIDIEKGQTRVKEIHTCDICIDAALYGYLTFDVGAKFGYGIFEIDLFNYEKDIFNKDNASILKAYLYFDHDSENAYIGAGLGECINLYKTPDISEQSESKEFRIGDDMTLFVKTRGTGLLTNYDAHIQGGIGLGGLSGEASASSREGIYIYQWYKDNIAIENASSDTYQISAMTENDFGTYKCIIALKDMPNIYKISEEINITEEVKEEEEQKEEKVEAKTVTKTGSVSENQNSSFTFMPTETGEYYFQKTQGADVVININGDRRPNNGYYELIGGYPYTVNVEWAFENTNYTIQITGPISY